MLGRAVRVLWGSAYFVLAIAPLCWAGNHILARAIANHVPPGGLSVLRWVVSAIVILPFAVRYLDRDWEVLSEKSWTTMLLAMAGGGVFGTLQFIALQYTIALNAAVFNSTVPAFIVVAAGLIFRDSVRLVQAIGISVSLGGVVTIVSRGDPAVLASLSFNGGDLLLVANMALFAVYSACVRLRPNVHWTTFILAFSIVSAIGNLPLAVLEHWSGQALRPDLMTAVAILYTGVFTSTVAYATWSRGIELIGAARAGVFLHLVPVYGMLLSTLLLGEQLHLFHIAGLGLILTGVWLAAKR